MLTKVITIFYFFLHLEKNVTYKQVPQVNLSNQIVSKNFKCFDVRKWCVTSNVDSKSTTSSTVFKKCKNIAIARLPQSLKLRFFEIFSSHLTAPSSQDYSDRKNFKKY